MAHFTVSAYEGTSVATSFEYLVDMVHTNTNVVEDDKDVIKLGEKKEVKTEMGGSC